MPNGFNGNVKKTSLLLRILSLAGEKRTIMPADYENSARYQNNLQTILKAGNVASTQTLVIKKDVLDLLQEPFFDENMPRLQDYDIVIRLIQICDFAYVNRPLVNVYASEQSITTDSKAMYDAAVRIIEKHSQFFRYISVYWYGY